MSLLTDLGITDRGGGWYVLPSGAKIRKGDLTNAITSLKQSEKKRPSKVTQSALTYRSRIAERAGTQFGGIRDVYTVAGYETQPTFEHYWSIYKRDGLAGRIVDMPAKTTWRTPPKIVEEGETDGTEFTQQWESLAKRLRFWRTFEKVDRLAGVGRYAVMVLGLRGDADDQALVQPVEAGSLRGPEDVLYAHVYNEKKAKILSWFEDVNDPNFGLPKIYELKTSRPGSSSGKDLRVHASRIIHVAEDALEDDVFGRPRLERPLNRLFDLDKIAAATGESYWQLASRILNAVVAPEHEITEPELEKLDDKLLELVHDLRRQFTSRGIDLKWLESTPPDPDKAAEMYFSLLAASAGIPKRILFGNEAGELASTTDQATYLGSINERQEQFAEPNIVRATADRLINFGALKEPTTKEYQVQWPVLFEETAKEQSETNKNKAETAKSLTPLGGDPREIVNIDADGNVNLIPTSEQELDTGSGGGSTGEPDGGIGGEGME